MENTGSCAEKSGEIPSYLRARLYYVGKSFLSNPLHHSLTTWWRLKKAPSKGCAARIREMKSEKGFARFSNCSAAPIFPTIYTCICLFFPPAFHFVLVVVVVVFLLSLFFFSLLAVYGTAKRPFISYYFGSICSFCGNYRERD